MSKAKVNHSPLMHKCMWRKPKPKKRTEKGRYNTFFNAANTLMTRSTYMPNNF